MAMVVATGIAAGIGLAGSIGGAIHKNKTAKRQERDARNQADLARARIASLEASRQDIINPYEAITDLSGNLSNTYNNLGVATQAAEMQIEQTDIALANTLDTIRATGGAAGGATALAQAALQSKKGVSASIESQEAKNEVLKAQGEQQLQQLVMSEQQRVQRADAAGRAFVYSEQEKREMMALDRAQTDLNNATGRKQAAQQAKYQTTSDMFGGISEAGFSFATAGIGG
tara:strand:+ start:4599 stop:5288 length:690 start_codon:yes stop_codon:yes gene_type:complete